MKPITVRAAVRRVANIRNLNLQMIPYKRYNIFCILYFIIYIYCGKQSQIPCVLQVLLQRIVRQIRVSIEVPCKKQDAF